MNRLQTAVLTTFVLLTCAAESRAQNALNTSCVDQLRLGVYNSVRTRSTSQQASSAVQSMCSTYQSLSQTNISASMMIDAPFFGLDARMSYGQLETLARSLCTSSDSRSMSAHEQDVLTQTISPDAMQAYRACVEADRHGLHFRRTISGSESDLVTLALAYTGTGTSGVGLQDIRVLPEDAYQCTGELWDARRNQPTGPRAQLTMIGNSFLSMSCRRRLSSTPNAAPGRQVFAPPAQLVVSTGGGALVTIIPEAAEIDAPPPVSTPVGSVVAFAGDTPPTGWLLCDGRPLSRTGYAALFTAIGTVHGTPDATSFNVPDYRGYFLRGADLNAGRDPDRSGRTPMAAGGRSGDAVGTVQSPAVGTHNHGASAVMGGSPFSSTASANSEMRNGFASGGNFHDNGHAGVSRQPLPVSVSVQAAGGSESRPLNASVNWIIRAR